MFIFTADFVILFTPSERISLLSYTKTKNTLVINTLENVKSRLHFWNYTSDEKSDGSWIYSGAQAGRKKIDSMSGRC